MKAYLCHDPISGALVKAALLQGTDGVPEEQLLPSQSDRACDLLFVHQQDLTPEVLSTYQFSQLVEVDQHFSINSFKSALQPRSPSLLQFNVSSPCAYQHRLAKLFLQQLEQQNNELTAIVGHDFDLPLHEAITNATIHGNLELDSGFSDLESMELFYKSVAQRLADPGFASRRVVVAASLQGRHIQFSVTDEGRGHALQTLTKNQQDTPHGRGLMLMSGHSESLKFDDGGRTSKIAFRYEE